VTVIFEEGVGFAVSIDEGNVITNTFVSNEMLFPQQKFIADKIRAESLGGKDPVVLYETETGTRLVRTNTALKKEHHNQTN